MSWLAFVEPLSSIAFGSGRPSDAGSNHLSETLDMPSPANMTGLITDQLRQSGIGHPRRVRGPVLAKKSSEIELLFRCPADVVDHESIRSRLDWGALVEPTDSESVASPFGFGSTVSGFVTASLLEDHLNGCDTLTRSKSYVLSAPYSIEDRVGIAKGVDGLLYSTSRIRLNDGYGYAAVVELEDRAIPAGGVCRFAGQGGSAAVTWHPLSDTRLPVTRTEANETLTRLVYLATPGVFVSGWRPNFPNNAELVAAVVEPPVTVSHGNQKRWNLSRAVKPGAMYLVRFSDEKAVARFDESAGKCLSAGPGSRTDRKLRAFQTSGFAWNFQGAF